MRMLVGLSFIAIGIIVVFLNILYKRTNHYQNSIKQLNKYLVGVPKKLEIVNLGSSYGKYAFDYEDIELRGFNFALQPQSLAYDYRILKQFTPNLKKNCIVLITVPNLVFGFLDYEDDSSNTKYYYFLDPKNIVGYNRFKYFLNVTLPLMSRYSNTLRIIKDVSPELPYDHEKSLLDKGQVLEDALNRVENWKKQFKLRDTISDELPQEFEKVFKSSTDLLREIIEYCINNDFRPIIIVPPTSNVINGLMSKKFIKKVLYDNIRIANKNKIPVLDYLYDERFQNYELYRNSDMLNKYGRREFMKVLMTDINKLGYVEGVDD